jgi:hypothetical protein
MIPLRLGAQHDFMSKLYLLSCSFFWLHKYLIIGKRNVMILPLPIDIYAREISQHWEVCYNAGPHGKTEV